MLDKFKIGDQKTYYKIVKPEDIASFDEGVVHLVCSTFSLAQAIEWSSRLFVLEMKEENEEGIGTMLQLEHKSPAMVNDKLEIVATVAELAKNELICNIEVKVKERVVAIGKTGQKILKKEKIVSIFSKLS